MKHQIAGYAAAIFALGTVTAPVAAQESGETLCAAPGLTILTDGTGDVDGTGLFPVGVPLDHADLVSVQVAQPPQDDGVIRLVFTITVAGDLPPVLPPYSGWYTSFKAQNGTFYGVRLATDDMGTPAFQSYTVGANNAGGMDGRFVDVTKPAESGAVEGNTITITVVARDVGIRAAGDRLTQFNAGSQQGLAPTGIGVLGAVLDGAPNDLSRRGELTTTENVPCEAAAKSGLERFGGALNFALLLPLALLGLRRRLR